MSTLVWSVYRIFAALLAPIIKALPAPLQKLLHLAALAGAYVLGDHARDTLAMPRDVVDRPGTAPTKTLAAFSFPANGAQSRRSRPHGGHGDRAAAAADVDPLRQAAGRFALLSDELLLHIFDILGATARPDLCSVSRTCKKLHTLADKSLYKTILFDSPEQHLSFSESLDRRPRRGSMIQDLVLAYPTSELSHLILDAPLDRSHYHPDLIDGLSRTVSAMSNLEVLNIAVPVRLLPGIGALFNGPFDLACLRECSMYFQAPDNAYWDLQETIHIFTHPTLETLTIKRARLDERGFDSLERPHSTALQRLDFVECDINDDALADIMEFPAGLREFHMSHTADPVPELEESSDEINEFVMALKPCAETLETIVIDHPTLGGRKVLRMRDFVAMKHLKMNFDTQLFGKTGKKPRLHSVGLPPELETLEFFGECGSDETVTELFASALQNSSFMARNLKTLTLAEGPKGIPKELVEACEGQKFTLLTKQMDDEDDD